jgi:hypothetical protein
MCRRLVLTEPFGPRLSLAVEKLVGNQGDHLRERCSKRNRRTNGKLTTIATAALTASRMSIR